MKKIIPILVLLSSMCLQAQGLVFHGKVRNSVYSYESDEQHNRAYQYLRFSLATADKKFRINSSVRALTDFNETIDSDLRFKAYALNLEANDLLGRVDLKLGRQFLHPGTVLGALDGLSGSVKINKMFSVEGYAGTESHFDRIFKVYELDDSFVAGGLFNVKNLYSTNLQLLYLHKSNVDTTLFQLTGLNVTNYTFDKTHFNVQAHYDMQNERMHRLMASVRQELLGNMAVNLRYKSQYPQIYTNSFFSIFSPKAYKQYHAGLSYEFYKDYYISTQYQLVQFDDGNANKVFFTINGMNASAGVLYESGYAGDQLSLMFDYAYEVIENLYASINLDYSKYRTEELYEYDNQLANALRLNYRLNKNWIIDLEYQWLNNKFTENDSRFLNHITYRW